MIEEAAPAPESSMPSVVGGVGPVEVSAAPAAAAPAPAEEAPPNLLPYERGDVVWAKMSGFPWWPARVRSLRKDEAGAPGALARIRFFGTEFGDERDYAVLGSDCLFAFAEKAECMS